MILLEMMLEVVIGVLVMEVGKVVDEVDKVADMKIPIEDLTEVILEILVFEWTYLQKTFLMRLCWLVGDAYWDDVRGVEWGDGYEGWQGGRWGDQLTNTEVEKVTNMMAEFATNTSYLAAKFLTNESGATWWPNFQLKHVVPPDDQISN